MKQFALLVAGIGILLVSAQAALPADGGAIPTMAKIAMNLQHFPSDQDKATLEGIIDSDDSTESEAAIAMALENLQHKVAKDDAERLADIVDDNTASAQARQLAGIVLRINHTASNEDKAALAALAGG